MVNQFYALKSKHRLKFSLFKNLIVAGKQGKEFWNEFCHRKINSILWKFCKLSFTDLINPFHATGLFLYRLETSENRGFLDVFRGW